MDDRSPSTQAQAPARPEHRRGTGATPVRRDGWTIPRQALFLKMLAATRSVTVAARVVRMSRESAHRLRARDPGGLFAVTWAMCVAAPQTARQRAAVDQHHRLAMALGEIPLAKHARAARATASTA